MQIDLGDEDDNESESNDSEYDDKSPCVNVLAFAKNGSAAISNPLVDPDEEYKG